MQAKAMGAGQTAEGGVKSGKVLFDIDAGAEDDGTFVTGVGIPGRKNKKVPAPSEDTKYFGSLEDELLDRVDNTEKDLHDMMKYLNAVEDMMTGNDLTHIRKMLDYTTQSVKHHSTAYSNIKVQVEEMNNDAKGALGKLAKHNDDIQ